MAITHNLKGFVTVVFVVLAAFIISSCSLIPDMGSSPPSEGLDTLTVSEGSLSPVFSVDTTDYTVTVSNGTTSIIVTGTTSDSLATVSSNSGVAQALNVGENTIVISVSTGFGTPKEYTVTVTREEAALGTRSVSAGYFHTMILKDDGTLWATGRGTLGMLGTGDSEHVSTPVEILVGGTSGGVAAVSSGVYHTMILKDDGTLWATGRNDAGQLGTGDTTDVSTPVEILVDGVSGSVAAVAAGGSHTIILKTDGTLWVTGNNNYGELGTGDTTGVNTPVEISVGDSTSVEAIAAGVEHTFILKTDGSLWVTGRNNYGQLGTGDTVDITTPVEIIVGGPSVGVAAVSAGLNHTMILKTDGTLWATGRNTNGQLGTGDTIDVDTPVEVLTGGISGSVASVAAGGSLTAILKTDGTLWMAGAYAGTYGNSSSTPLEVTGESVSGGVDTISSGGSHVLIVTTDGALWAKGTNGYGQLGTGDTSVAYTPVLVTY